jgi:hypothetical protein
MCRGSVASAEGGVTAGRYVQSSAMTEDDSVAALLADIEADQDERYWL